MKDSDILITGVVAYLGYEFIRNFKLPDININASLFGDTPFSDSPLTSAVQGASNTINEVKNAVAAYSPTRVYTSVVGNNPSEVYAMNILKRDKVLYDWGLASNQTMIDDITNLAQTQVDRMNEINRMLGLPQVTL